MSCSCGWVWTAVPPVSSLLAATCLFVHYILLPSPFVQADRAVYDVEVLERNISSLFNTAKLEGRRKDEELGRLRTA